MQSGLLPYMLPRFTLKTQVRVEVVAPGAQAEAAFGQKGQALFSGVGATWRLQVLAPEHPGTRKFVDWINSDVGLRTVTMYAPDGGAPVFALATLEEAEEEAVVFEGDAALGKTLSAVHCGRCHVSASDQGLVGIGSTPSFFVLRTLSDWDERFQVFYVLNPHPAFTQITELTEPFPDDRPSPIHPVEITLDELDAILAYVAALEPADLGAPLIHQ